MRPLPTYIALALMVACVCGFGCRRNQGPPPPLALENIPVEFAKGFRNSKPAVKTLSAQLVAAVAAKDYPAAHAAAHDLCSSPEAGNEEKRLAARAMLTITVLLQQAQAQGDEKAAEVLTAQKKFK